MHLKQRRIFSNNLNNLLEKHELTRYEFVEKINRRFPVDDGEELNFKYSTVSRWLNSTIYPRIDKIDMIADFFNINVSELIEEPLKENQKKLYSLFDDIDTLFTNEEEKQKKTPASEDNEL